MADSRQQCSEEDWDYALQHVIHGDRYVPPSSIPEAISPRVWIADAYPQTSIRQLLSAIRVNGGVMEVNKTILNAPLPSGSLYPVSMFSVLFSNEHVAREFIEHTQAYGLKFVPLGFNVAHAGCDIRVRDRCARSADVFAYPIVQMDPISKIVPRYLWAGFTRVWQLSTVPKTAVWFILNCIGLNDILHATYDDDTLVLQVEFVSVRAAKRAQCFMTLQDTLMPYLPGRPTVHYLGDSHPSPADTTETWIQYVADQCDGNPDEMLDLPFYTLFLSAYDVEVQFNQMPFNMDWPSRHEGCMEWASLGIRTAEDHWDLLKDCEPLSRDAWSCDTTKEVQNQFQWLRESMNKPEWQEIWSKWFSQHGTSCENFLNMFRYGRTVNHRKQAGFLCPGDCGHGCNIRSAPVPAIVQAFQNGEIEATGDIDSDTGSSRSASVDSSFAVVLDPATSMDYQFWSVSDSPLIPSDKFRRFVKQRDDQALRGRDEDDWRMRGFAPPAPAPGVPFGLPELNALLAATRLPAMADEIDYKADDEVDEEVGPTVNGEADSRAKINKP